MSSLTKTGCWVPRLVEDEASRKTYAIKKMATFQHPTMALRALRETIVLRTLRSHDNILELHQANLREDPAGEVNL
jgi:hypothetical protein